LLPRQKTSGAPTYDHPDCRDDLAVGRVGAVGANVHVTDWHVRQVRLIRDGQVRRRKAAPRSPMGRWVSPETGDALMAVLAVPFVTTHGHGRGVRPRHPRRVSQQLTEDQMDVGSVEYAIIAFPGNHFSGEIAPAIEDLVDRDIVHILDLAFVIKDGDGNVEAIELSSLPEEEARAFKKLDVSVGNLLNEDDIRDIGESLDADSSAALLVWENAWAARFVKAVRNANGVLLARETIPAPVVQAALDYAGVAE
jgi:hypothetical protein